MKIIQIIALAVTAALILVHDCQAKSIDANADLVYYGYRYYSPNLGRWLNRDPIGETGFQGFFERSHDDFADDWVNLYSYVLNNPVGFNDSYGLEVYEKCVTDKTHGGYEITGSSSTGISIWLSPYLTVDQMRVAQRKCNFRCYHKDTDNCYSIPCTKASCMKDHGVAIRVTINASGSGAAATCKSILPEVRNGTITGGSITRNAPNPGLN